MIKLTYKQVKDHQFVQALAKLAGHSFRDQRLAYNIAKIVRKFEIEVKTAQELYLKLLKKFALLDEKGEFIPDNGVPGTFQVPAEKSDEWKKAREEFELVEFDLACHKVRIDQLEGVGLSAIDMIALEPCLSELEEVKAATEMAAAN